MFEVKIEKLVFGGQGLGHHEGRPVFCWNALPGETVLAEPLKTRRGATEAAARKIIVPAPERIEPAEADHFLACSPWQILSEEGELLWKKKIASETYNSIGRLDLAEMPELADAGKSYHYRNKMEYSFALDDSGDISLAFFERGTHRRRPIRRCLLASPAVNETASLILEWLNNQPLPEDILKTLIVRANSQGETIAGLFITEYFDFAELPDLDNKFTGFQIYYSRPECPASSPDKLIFSAGREELEEEAMGVKLKFGLFSFFQVNPPIFTLALEDIRGWLDKKRTLVDFYGGVGAIGLALAGYCKRVYLVDNNRPAVDFAERNIAGNNIPNAKAVCAPAEKMPDLVKSDRIIALDPPRAGLHGDLIARLLDKKPARIIYLSCNLSTQARDIGLLGAAYAVKFIKLYNFFPRTPHVEALCVLERL